MPPDGVGGTALVVGAGVGGLAAAIGLRRAGWQASRRAGRVIQQQSALACALRNTAVRLLPERVLLAGIARTADWRPPPLG